MKNSILLIDEAKGRKVAQNMGLHIMGTIGILLVAYEEGILDRYSIEACIDNIRDSELRISDDLLEYLHEKISK